MSAKNVGSRTGGKVHTKSPIHKACQQTPTTKLLRMARNQVHGSRRRTVVTSSLYEMWTVTNSGTKKSLTVEARSAWHAVQLALEAGLAKKAEKLSAIEADASA